MGKTSRKIKRKARKSTFLKSLGSFGTQKERKVKLIPSSTKVGAGNSRVIRNGQIKRRIPARKAQKS